MEIEYEDWQIGSVHMEPHPDDCMLWTIAEAGDEDGMHDTFVLGVPDEKCVQAWKDVMDACSSTCRTDTAVSMDHPGRNDLTSVRIAVTTVVPGKTIRLNKVRETTALAIADRQTANRMIISAESMSKAAEDMLNFASSCNSGYGAVVK